MISQHLLSPKSPELSELEFGRAIVGNACARWMLRCLAAAGHPDSAALDLRVLHPVNSRQHEKKRVESSERGKEVFLRTTEHGRAACEGCRSVRATCLMPGFAGTVEGNARLGNAAGLLRTLSGRSDAAARAACTAVFTSLDALPVSAPDAPHQEAT